MRWKILNQQDTAVVVAVLREIERELLRCYWNKTQTEMDSPFENTGNSYSCGAFSVNGYNWGYNEKNFVYTDRYLLPSSLIAEWYKHLGRGDYVEVPEDWKMDYLADMLENCKEAIRKDFGEIE